MAALKLFFLCEFIELIGVNRAIVQKQRELKITLRALLKIHCDETLMTLKSVFNPSNKSGFRIKQVRKTRHSLHVECSSEYNLQGIINWFQHIQFKTTPSRIHWNWLKTIKFIKTNILLLNQWICRKKKNYFSINIHVKGEIVKNYFQFT